MAYNKNGLSLVDIANNSNQASLFKYATTDAIATVEGANYFAFDSEDPSDLGNLLKTYDFIFVGASNDSDIYFITSTGPIVISKIGAQSQDITLAEGSILVGNSSSKAVALVAKTLGQLLLGNGTTLASVAMSGDATIDYTGALTIAAGAVENSMLAADSVTFSKVDGNDIPYLPVSGGHATWSGGGTTLVVNVPGITAADEVSAIWKSAPTQASVISEAITGTDQINFKITAANTSNDGVVSFIVYRLVP